MNWYKAFNIPVWASFNTKPSWGAQNHLNWLLRISRGDLGNWLKCILSTSLSRFSRHTQPEGGPGGDPEPTREIISVIWPGNALRSIIRKCCWEGGLQYLLTLFPLQPDFGTAEYDGGIPVLCFTFHLEIPSQLDHFTCLTNSGDCSSQCHNLTVSSLN